MVKSKLEEFISVLEKNKKISFYLYNVEYTIVKVNDKSYLIQQFGIEQSYTYSNLNDLFDKFIVYGDLLKECINDIKII